MLPPSFFAQFVVGAFLGCASEDYSRLYHTEEKAPSLSWDDIEALDLLGPTVIDGGVNFSVYSENATRLEVLLFDDPESALPAQQYELARRGDVWNVFVEGLGEGQYYGFVAWGPNWPYDEEWFPGSTAGFLTDVDFDGNRFNPNKLLFDPWSKALHRDHDWSKGSTASGPDRYQQTYAAGSKSVVVASDYAWSEHEESWRELRASDDHEGHDWTDLVLYEVHPKGFTKNPASGVEHPGTFLGIGENAAYLSDLGITGVELMPIHEKPSDGGYWGYNTLNFFTPELTYSATYDATGRPDEIIDEFKWMVDQLHQYDIEVILDVVYNHTGEGGLWRERLYFESYDAAYAVNYDPKEVAGLYSYRGLDNQAYYALSSDGQTYWNNTGVGNETRTNHTPMVQLITDSLRFYVEEMHVDGFRFDLAGILGEPDLDYNGSIDPAETILQDIVDDPVLQEYNTRIIAEPWTAGGSGPGIGGFPLSTDDPAIGWGEWNAAFRDWWRSFVNTDDFLLNYTEGLDGGAVITGSNATYAWNGRKPYHSVNYVTCHDGFTMYDLFSYDEKQNGCGLLNPICCDDPNSVWCDSTSGESNNRSRDWGQTEEPFKRQLMRNMFTAMMISHGTPMLYGGDEWIRTQFGNNNAYTDSGDNEWNWFQWGEWQSTGELQRHRMHDFVRNIVTFRKRHTHALSPPDWDAGMPLAWKTASGSAMQSSDWSSKNVMIHYTDDGSGEPEIAILINMERSPVVFSLPSGHAWAKVVDTQEYYDMPGTSTEGAGWFSENPEADPYVSQNVDLDASTTVGSSYTVAESSIVILVEP
jgi:isoamylase